MKIIVEAFIRIPTDFRNGLQKLEAEFQLEAELDGKPTNLTWAFKEFPLPSNNLKTSVIRKVMIFFN